MKASTATAEHYTWGTRCDGWHLLRSDALSVIEERIPPGTGEVLHYHQRAQQFFYILSGTATFEVAGEVCIVGMREGLPIPAGAPHKISNGGAEDLWFLVISEPKAHGDRTNLE